LATRPFRGPQQAYQEALERERQRQQALNERLANGRNALRRDSIDSGSIHSGSSISRKHSPSAPASRPGSVSGRRTPKATAASAAAGSAASSVAGKRTAKGAARSQQRSGTPSVLGSVLGRPPRLAPVRPAKSPAPKPVRRKPEVVVEPIDPTRPWGRLSIYAGLPSLGSTSGSDGEGGGHRRSSYPTPDPSMLIRQERLRPRNGPAGSAASSVAPSPAAPPLAAPAAGPAAGPSRKRPTADADAHVASAAAAAAAAAAEPAHGKRRAPPTKQHSPLAWFATSAGAFGAALPPAPFTVPPTWLKPTHVRSAQKVAAGLGSAGASGVTTRSGL